MDDRAKRRETDRLRQPHVPEYVDHLERAIRTHATYATIAGDQAIEMEKKARTGKTLADGEQLEVLKLVELANLQSSIHTLGLTVAISALAQLAAMGVDVPEPPEVVPLGKEGH